MSNTHLVSIIIPACNEADCIGTVLDHITQFCRNDQRVRWEVIVVDNGSTDDTTAISITHGAKTVFEPRKGYGQACWRGVQESTGDILMFIDGDGAVQMEDARFLLDSLFLGADLVIGIRTRPDPGAMTLPQRFGNWLACALIQLIWHYPIQDLGPFRVLRRNFFHRLQMADRDFGWTIEMQLKAYGIQANIVDCPVRWRARISGHSKIGGTLQGIYRAGRDILGMIARLWWQQRQSIRQDHLSKP